MKRPRGAAPRAMQTGSVAVELALILPLMFILMFATLQFGRIFWQYNAVQKAATDAARLLASMPAADMQDSSKVTIARALAQQIVADAASDASIRPTVLPSDIAIVFWCGANSSSFCAYSASPSSQVTQVAVSFEIGLADDGFYNFGPTWSAWVANITLHAESTMPVTN